MALLLALTLLLAPAYVIKTNLFGLPNNVLMLWIFLVWASFFIWLARKNQVQNFINGIRNTEKPILIFTFLFFTSGLISLFYFGIDQNKLGQFIVLFLQPISLFFISRFVFKDNPNAKNSLLSTVYCLLALAGAYAIFQYLTLMGLPSAYWGNANEPKRALAFFIHPNFYALWSAPLLALLIPDVFKKISTPLLGGGVERWKVFAWVIGALGLFLSMSRSGWLGLGIAIIIYLIVAADKKIRKLALMAIIVIVVVIVSIPNLRWRFVLPFYGEKSAVSRLSLWHTGTKAIKESPVFGLGLTGFANNWERLNTDPNLDTHNFPHNIFLNFWVETGLLGLISFLGLALILIYRGLKKVFPPQDLGRGRGEVDTLRLGIALFLICLITQGQLDNPYFKNDLAMVFWIVLSLTK